MESLFYQITPPICKTVFRAYDIRGVVDEQLNENFYYTLGLAIGSEALEKNQQQVVVGRDGRLTSPAYAKAMIVGLKASGCDVINIGQVPSPVLYFATNVLITKTGVMVTASHNPANYNGIKIVLDGKTLTAEGIQKLYQRTMTGVFSKGKGEETHCSIIPKYIQTIVEQIQLKKSLKIVLDCGNGVGAETAPELYRQLGCEVIELYCTVDGRFPHHHPDPVVPENLQDLIKAVKQHQADLGLALDGDADRVGFVTNLGEIVWPDRQVMYFAQDILKTHPGEKIIFDVKCTNLLSKIIAKNGGQPLMWRTGHSILKAKMFEEKAPLAGELSGHIFFNDQRWYGFDDGVYVGARLLELLSQENRTASEVFAELPNNMNTPEIKVVIPSGNPHLFMEHFMEHAHFEKAKVVDIDGLRVDFGYGWGLVRASNTTPCLTLRFEADTQANLEKIQTIFRQQLLQEDPQLEIPF